MRGDAGSPTTRPILGRDQEISEIQAFLAAEDALPSALVLEGEAGIGKTALWQAAVETAGRRYVVLAARPAATETDFAFSGLTDLIGDAVQDVLPSLPAPQRQALRVALLVEEPGPTAPPLGTVAAAFLSVLRFLSAERPLLVAVDDVQWLDPSTLAVLAYSSRRLGAEQVALFLARRIEASGDPGPPLGDALGGQRHRRLQIDGLPAPVVQEILRSRLGFDPERAALAQVMEASGGNPFFALELGRALARPPGQPAPGRPLAVPRTLQALVSERIRHLPRATSRMLLLASLAVDSTLGLLGLAVGADPWGLLRTAVAAEVIEIRDDRVRFTHPLLASAVAASMELDERRRAHGLLAAAVSDPEQRARHLALAASGPDEAVAGALDSATMRAAGRGAPAAAAELAELAAELTPARSEHARRSRLLTAAELHLVAGEHARARGIAEDLVAVLPPGTERARALHTLGWTESMATAGLRFEQALAEGGDLPAMSGQLCTFLGMLQVMGGNLEQGEALARRAEAEAERAGDPLAVAFAVGTRITAQLCAGRPFSEDDLDRAVAVEAASTEDQRPRLPNPPIAVLGLARMFFGRWDEARTAFEILRQQSADRGDEESTLAYLLHRARLEVRAGDWAVADSSARELDEMNNLIDAGHRAGIGDFARAMVLVARGDPSARSRCEKAIPALGAIGAGVWEAECRGLLGVLELSGGNPAAAVRELEPVLPRLEATGYAEPTHTEAVPNLVEAYIEIGSLEAARPLLERHARTAVALDHPLGCHQVARCRGLLAAAEGDPEAALAHFDGALERSSPYPLERARTLLARGVALRRTKQHRAAREALGAALAEFERLGAQRWAERARGDLARVGGRRPAGSALTATEARVAELVAQGHSNKHVAATLSISVKSVEGHLSQVYRKLDVHSRGELMRLLLETSDAS